MYCALIFRECDRRRTANKNHDSCYFPDFSVRTIISLRWSRIGRPCVAELTMALGRQFIVLAVGTDLSHPHIRGNGICQNQLTTTWFARLFWPSSQSSLRIWLCRDLTSATDINSIKWIRQHGWLGRWVCPYIAPEWK